MARNDKVGRKLLEDRDEVVFLLIHLAVDGAEHVGEVAASGVGSHSPTEGKFVALVGVQVPLLDEAKQALNGRVGGLLVGLGHDDKKFIAAVTEDQVATAEGLTQHFGELHQHEVALMSAK